MNLSKNKVSRLFQFFTCFCLVHLSQAQNIDLGIQFTGAQPTQVPVGSVFAITGQVFVEANATGVTAGQTVVATAEFKDPDGLLIGSHTETWNGFPDGPATLDNDPTATRQVLFTIPWSQAQKWQALDGNKSQWSVTLRLDGVTGEVSLATNQQTHFFEVIIPDLEVRDNPVVSATDLTTGNLSNVFLPNAEVTVQGVVENIGGVTTQEGVLFPLIARLLNANGTVMDEEMIVLPNNGNTRMLAGDVINFTIPNLHVPPNAAANETFTVEVIVDPTDLATGQHLVFETDDTTNNRKQATFSINAVEQRLTIDPDSFVGDTGTFRGLDPIRLSFAVRNTSTVAVATGDNFTAQVLLSENDSSSTDDFILREFDLSGNALGANLLPNETITFDWIQQLPDNYEGDYYLLVNITGSGDFALENTPVITLISENKGNTELVEPNNNLSTERPSSNTDGRLVAYEETDNFGIQQIFVKDMVTNIITQITTSSDGTGGGNADSFRPRISSDGTTIVFHSKASNLIENDQNGHEDVFLYKIGSQGLIRASDYVTGQEPNEGSFYPDLNFNGTLVVFESEASNLQSNGLTTSGRQIFLWDLRGGGAGSIQAITDGNGESSSASIDQTGNFVVYSSYASNLLSPVSDLNNNSDVFLYKVEDGTTHLCSLTSLGAPATGGASTEPMISGDGSTIVFKSSASNMIFGKGISSVKVLSGGAGYFGTPTAVVSDSRGPGSGALLDLSNAIDSYGQIQESSVRIVANGTGYVNPVVTVISDPAQASPSQVAEIDARLSHEEGEIYSIKTADVLPNPVSPVYSKRISESASGIGGDMGSREPAISYDGQLIAFTTKSSNLLDQNITREDGQVFYNQAGKIASARAIIVGGIGEIEIQNPGIGYNAGFLKIEDFSGNGSGAVASYQVDSANGRIISITVVNPGTDYQLDTTVVTVENPNGGSGFQAGTIRFLPVFGFGNNRTGGGRIHRIEMTENGLGYQLPQNGNSISSIISVDGDGADLDSNGKPDAKLNADRIHLGTNGEVYLEQRFEIEFLSTTSLANTILTFSDYTKSINITFGNSASQLQVNTTGKSASTIRDEVISMIQTQWSNPAAISNGPLIDGNSSGGSTFTFKGLSAGVVTNNPSSVRVSSQSNMIFSGNGYTRATPVIAPPSVIYGYSEVLSGTTTVSTLSGRRIFDVQIDTFSDDIYLYDQNASNNQRISKSTFGFPVNYLPSVTSSMPSNRFPSISADGRHVFFSSDATGQGGLAFNLSNQDPNDQNNVRDVYYHDRKTAKLPTTSTGSSITLFSNSGEAVIDNNSSLISVNPLGGAILSVTINTLQDRTFYSPPKVSVIGTGTGAELNAVLETNSSSTDYGKVIGLNVIKGGSGYLEPSTSFKLIPSFNVVGNGIPAEISTITTTTLIQGNNNQPARTVFNYEIQMDRDVSGELKDGSGYVVAPRMLATDGFDIFSVTQGQQSLERLPLNPTTSNSSSVAFFQYGPQRQVIIDAALFGGFTQSPVFIDLNVTDPLNQVAQVGLLVDGFELTELTKTQPPFSFAWVPDQAKEYSLQGFVDNSSGNRKTISLGNYLINDFYGSGVSAKFNGDSNISVPSNSVILLSVDASSEYGIKEVEFFINNISVGKAFDQNSPTFLKSVDLSKYSFGEGTHQISMVATDYQGNQAGSFDPYLTNIDSRQNKVLIALPITPPSLLPTTSISYPSNNFSTTSTSKIRLEASASDPDGSLEGVQFYVNGVAQYAWSGILDFNGTVPLDGALLTIDDGTGKLATTFEFDNDSIIAGSGSSSLIITNSNLLDDLSLDGNYTGFDQIDYFVQVDGGGNPNTYRWSRDGGITFIKEKIAMNGSFQLLENGISVKFDSIIGHALGDRWTIRASANHKRVIITSGGTALENSTGTRNALNQAIAVQRNLGLLSIFSVTEGTSDKLHLHHSMDQHLVGNTIVSGSSLSVNGGNISFVDNDIEPANGIPDNFIRRDHSYGLPLYPFGMTWSPGSPGTYHIYSVAMDTTSRSMVMSEPVVITATSGTGQIPSIELDTIDSPLIYSGSSREIDLTARASDTDGKVIEVRFYANGQLIGTDDMSPYNATLNINTNGHYEIYAVASDDDGNDVTSSVQRVVVETSNELLNNLKILNKPHLETQHFVQGGFVHVIADVEQFEEEIASMVLFVDGKLESNGSKLVGNLYELSWQPMQKGVYKLQLFASDSSENFISSSEVVEVKVSSSFNWSGGLPRVDIMNPVMDEFFTTKSSIQITAIASDPDFDLKEVQFYLNGSPIGDPLATPVSGYSDFFPYLIRWEPQATGIHFVYAVATDYFGNTQMSQAIAVRVTTGTSLPPQPQFSGIVQVADIQSHLVGNGLSFSISNPGFGYISPPKVVIDNFGTGGNGASFIIKQSDIDSLTGEIKSINQIVSGSGYTSLPRIRLEGGFPFIEASGVPGLAEATATTLSTSPDDAGNVRESPGLLSIGVVSRGSGYIQPPTVMISHPTAEGAEAEVTLRPATNGRGSEIDQITVTLPGGGKPIRFADANGTNPIEWLPGYDVPRTSVSLIGGIPFDEATFEFAEPVFTDSQSVLSSIKFYAVGNNQHLELPELNDNPFRWTFGTPQPGVYALYAEVVDSRGNVHASEPIYREVRPASLPEGDFTSPYRARGEAIIVNGQITGIELTSPGASYNLPPKVIFEGDGTGAVASATIDTTTGHVTGITINNSGSGYTNAKVRFEEGWVTPQQIDEYVLGETITMGLTAFAKSAEIREIRLIVNNAERDETTYPTLTAEPDYGGYEFPSQEYGTLTGQGELDANIQRLDRWKYDGTMPDYNIYFTPSDLGIYNIEAMLIDHTGYSTVTSSYRVRVHNGEPPVIELVTPRTGESFALDYDRNQDIRLVAKAQDPDWQARFGGDQQLDRRNELNRVWFYADDQFVGVGNRILGTDLYQFVWRPTVAGTYRITAIAVDDQVGDVNQEFGDIGRVGGIGTSDPQYLTITNRSGSRPPDIRLLNPAIPQIYPGFLEIGDEFSSQPPPNDDRNLQPDLDPQNLANEFRLAAEYPNLYTSGSRDMVWALADDRDGDLQSVQFYVNGANGVIQLRKNPANGDSFYLNDGTVARDIVFGTDLSVGPDTIETAKNLKNFLNGLVSTGYKINPFLLPGAATVYEKSTVLIDFENSFDSNLTSSDETKIFPWLFKELPNTLGEYQVRQSHPVAQVLNGFGGTYFAHPFVPGLNGIFSIYAVAKDTSNNRVMSIPSHYKSTMGDFNSSSTSATIQMLANGTTVPFGNNSHTIISNVTSQYPLEYVEFFDNGRIFDTPESVVDENGTYHRGRAIEFDSPPYLATWNVSEVGEHIIYARFTDIKGNSFLSNQIKVLVEPPEGKHPQGTLTIYIGADDGDGELVAGASVGSTVIARAEFVDADSSGQTVDTAHFYLNGNLISSQTSPPFFAKISPTPMKRLSAPEGSWELAVVGKDEDGNEVELKQTALVRGAVSLPSARMISYSGSTGEIYDGTNLRLSVVANGDAESLEVMRGMAFFANGIFLGTDLGIDEVDGSGNVMQKTYEFEFEVNYLLHAKSDGSLSITGLTVVDRAGALQPNITAVVATNSLSYNVITPKPWENVESLTGEINRGLLDGSLSPTELIQITKTRTGDNYYTWIAEVLERSAFEQRVDLMAAHKVALGEWFQSYQDFADDINFYLKSTTGLLPSATSSALLKTYIDDLLQGADYRSKFGQLPFLVGSWFSREIYNYPINRKDFVAQCLYNKYGQISSVSQNLQGSRKLLSFWGISEPTYWEINGIRPTSPTVQPPEPDPPPRRDAGYSILNNFNPGRYFSGELAVELIWRLATETKTNGLPYILYTNDIRNSVFSTATLMSLMWQDKWDFSEEDIQELLPYTETDKIKKVLTDPRFNARFNFLWGSSNVIDETKSSYWKNENWFGDFNDEHFPWIYKPGIGWLYSSGNDQDNVWFKSPRAIPPAKEDGQEKEKIEWLWTKKSFNLNSNYLIFYRWGGADTAENDRSWIAFEKKNVNDLSLVDPLIYNKDQHQWEPYVR